MNKVQTPFLAPGATPDAHAVELEHGWAGGSVLLRVQGAQGQCQRDILRSDLAIGVCFETPGSEVNWLLEGKRALSKKWSATTRSHDMIVLPPGCEFQARCRGAGEGLWLFLDPQSIDEDPRVKTFAGRATVDWAWTKDRLSWAIATELRKECHNGFPRGPMFLETASVTFLSQIAYVATKSEARGEAIRALRGASLRAVLDYIDSHLARNITLSELSGLVDLTPRYFCSAFKEAIGSPPHQYQIERRIERAKFLLIDGGLPLADIACCVGFNSQSHLNHHFCRITGNTPARFRDELRKSGRQRPASRG